MGIFKDQWGRPHYIEWEPYAIVGLFIFMIIMAFIYIYKADLEEEQKTIEDRQLLKQEIIKELESVNR